MRIVVGTVATAASALLLLTILSSPNSAGAAVSAVHESNPERVPSDGHGHSGLTGRTVAAVKGLDLRKSAGPGWPYFRNVSAGNGPAAVVYYSPTSELFVADYGSSNLTVVDANLSLNRTVHVGSNPFGLVVDNARAEIFVANVNSDNVSVVRAYGKTVAASVRVGGFPEGLAYDAAMGEVFVANYGGNSVSVINDTNDTVVSTIRVLGDPVGVAYDDGAGQVFVATYNQSGGSNFVTIIDGRTNAVVRTVAVGLAPMGVGPYPLAAACYAQGRGEIYVANPGADSVSVLNDTSDTVVATIAVGNYPDALTCDDAARTVFVADAQPGGISAVDPVTNREVARIPVATYIGGVAYSPLFSGIWTSETGQGSVVMVPTNLSDGVTLTSNVPGAADLGMPFNLTTSTLWNSTGFTYAYSSPPALGCPTTGGSTVRCTPTVVGNYSAYVNVTDPLGGGGMARGPNLWVQPALVPRLSVSNATLWLGDTILINGSVTGGFPPYTYNFSNLPPGCVPEGREQIGCLPTEDGNYSIQFEVRDSLGWTVTATQLVSITFDFVIISPANSTAGQTIVIRVDSARGIGTLSYAYSGLPPGQGCASSDSPSVACTPSRAGTYSVGVVVTDRAGHRASHSVTLIVNSPAPQRTSPPSNFLGLPGDEGFFVVTAIGAGIVVIVAAAMLGLRGRAPK